MLALHAVCALHALSVKVYVQVGVIKSPLLTRTLFDVYLGSNPVSPDAKDSIGRGLKNLATEP